MANVDVTKTMTETEKKFRLLVGGLYNAGTQFERPIYVTPAYSNYNKISSAVIEVNGSPVKGTVVLIWDSGYFGSDEGFDEAYFIARGKSRKLATKTRGLMYHSTPSSRRTEAKMEQKYNIVWDFWKALNIPSMRDEPSEDGHVYVRSAEPIKKEVK